LSSVLQDAAEQVSGEYFTEAKLERLLMDSFFSDVIDDDERSRLSASSKTDGIRS
jgi:hypothetical protein